MSGRAGGAWEPHPDSVLPAADGRTVYLKAHRCLWSGDFAENSLPAILECYRERVARAEIDVNMLRDEDFLVTHDAMLDAHTTGAGPVRDLSRREADGLRLRWLGEVSSLRPPLLSEVVDAVHEAPFPTLLELDLKDVWPLPWDRAEELARLVEPVRDRVVFGGCADWNLRRLLAVDATLPVAFDPQFHLDWTPREPRSDSLPGVRGAYGYLDTHPLARVRWGAPAEYLRERLCDLMRLVPGARDFHARLAAVERMLDDGLDVAGLLHAHGVGLDVWTLDVGRPGWEARLERVVAAGVDMVTTNTPRQMAAHWRRRQSGE